MHRHEVEQTVKTALHHGLDAYTSDELAADVNNRLGTNTLDAETAATFMAAIEQHQDDIAAAVTDDILQHLDIPTTRPTENNQPVAADGDSILAINAGEIIPISGIGMNAILYGHAVLNDDIISAAVATAGVCAILTVWLNHRHNIRLIKSED